MVTVTVYTRPDCYLCRATKIYLAQHQIPYTELDVSKDRAAAAAVVGLGYTALPVVTAGDEHWSGFRVNRLLALKARG
jgi:glutaredoxin-like protein NrdH